MSEAAYHREERNREKRAWFEYPLYLLAAYPVVWIGALVTKALWFLMREGRWPQVMRDDPKWIDENVLDSLLNFALFTVGLIVQVWALLIFVSFLGWVTTRSRIWRNAFAIGVGSFASLVGFIWLDPGELFTWFMD